VPCRGSLDGPVKADSPLRGWSGAESLDRTEASPTMCYVMADSGAEDDRVATVWAGGLITSCWSVRRALCQGSSRAAVNDGDVRDHRLDHRGHDVHGVFAIERAYQHSFS
jgi:hypothetical protein